MQCGLFVGLNFEQVDVASVLSHSAALVSPTGRISRLLRKTSACLEEAVESLPLRGA